MITRKKQFEVYFYIYKNKLFVVDKPLSNNNELIPHTKSEALKFKVLYSRLTRSINHSKMKVFMHYYVAESIFKMNKPTEKIIKDIYTITN